MDEKEKFWEDPESESHRQAVCEAAEQAQKITGENAKASIKSVAQTESDEFWQRWGRYSPPDPLTRQREPVNAMSGAIERGGGSKSGKKHKNPVKKAPEYMKYLGM